MGVGWSGFVAVYIRLLSQKKLSETSNQSMLNICSVVGELRQQVADVFSDLKPPQRLPYGPTSTPPMPRPSNRLKSSLILHKKVVYFLNFFLSINKSRQTMAVGEQVQNGAKQNKHPLFQDRLVKQSWDKI